MRHLCDITMRLLVHMACCARHQVLQQKHHISYMSADLITCVASLTVPGEETTKLSVSGHSSPEHFAENIHALQVNDGSTLTGLQVLVDPDAAGYRLVDNGSINTGAAVRVQGELVESPGRGQKVKVTDTVHWCGTPGLRCSLCCAVAGCVTLVCLCHAMTWQATIYITVCIWQLFFSTCHSQAPSL